MSMPPDAQRIPHAAEPVAPGGDPYSRRVERAVDALRHRAEGARRMARPAPPPWVLIHAEMARARRRRRATNAPTD
jgi:hypothetical protein